LRSNAKNAYDYFNIVEKSVLEMEDEDLTKINDDLLTA